MCKCGVSYINYGPMIGYAYEINRRIIFLMRVQGIGIQDLTLFYDLIESKFHNKTLTRYIENVIKAAK